MSIKLLNKIFLFIGFASLVHAAFSAAQHRSYLRITEQDGQLLPLDIIIQTLISLLIVIYNIVQVVGDFKEIRATVDLQTKSWDTLGNLPSFYMFCHRGKSLKPGYEPPLAGGKSDLSYY